MNILLLGPESRNRNVEAFLRAQGCNVQITAEPLTLETLAAQKIDFLISNGYAPIIKPPVVSAYWHRIVNMHPTYLPYGKGINPNFWSFFEGTPKGVSLHFIDAGIDTGDIIAQRQISFADSDTLRTSYDTLLRETERLLLDTWESLATSAFTVMRQQELGVKVRYRSRLDSEQFMDILPRRWDTSTADIEAMGAEFALSEQFWTQCTKGPDSNE